ncbi:VOC family protein [Spirillospora sp. NPDC029432]|uniref:VOC family protein n=1 Tax=Spirillospora sp. NPDC029432 TaxID=3154599 RepID=UPI0034561BB7
MTRLTSNAPAGTPNWLDLGIPDMERAKEFYRNLFGWEFVDYGPEAGHYHGCLLRGESVAGMMQNPEPGADYWWSLYFSTDDLDGTVKRVTDAGGSVVEPPMDVMDQGRMAIVTDAMGAQFGLWQGQEHIGSAIVNEPGSFVWNELTTTDRRRASEFYAAVFGHTPEDMPGDMGYTVLNRADGQGIAGIMDGPAGSPSAWSTYFQVEDPDAAVRTVRENGGEVVAEPEDTPYGRIAFVRDPFGVEFRLMRPTPA